MKLTIAEFLKLKNKKPEIPKIERILEHLNNPDAKAIIKSYVSKTKYEKNYC